MTISTTKPLPASKELVEILKKDFSETHDYKLFGLGKKSIIVGQSTLVGAQISVFENDIMIQSTIPNELGGLFSFMGLTELGVFLLPFIFPKKADSCMKDKEIL